jgi:hypothetical protein
MLRTNLTILLSFSYSAHIVLMSTIVHPTHFYHQTSISHGYNHLDGLFGLGKQSLRWWFTQFLNHYRSLVI